MSEDEKIKKLRALKKQLETMDEECQYRYKKYKAVIALYDVVFSEYVHFRVSAREEQEARDMKRHTKFAYETFRRARFELEEEINELEEEIEQ